MRVSAGALPGSQPEALASTQGAGFSIQGPSLRQAQRHPRREVGPSTFHPSGLTPIKRQIRQPADPLKQMAGRDPLLDRDAGGQEATGLLLPSHRNRNGHPMAPVRRTPLPGRQKSVWIPEAPAAGEAQEELQGEHAGCANESVPGSTSVAGSHMIRGVGCPFGHFVALKWRKTNP